MAGNTRRVLEDEFKNSVSGERARVNQQSTADRLWDSLSTSYGRKLDASNEAYDKEISAAVPLHAHGECYGAAHGGILEQDLHELPVLCRPKDLPDGIRVDVTELKIGDGLTVAQLTLPAGVKADIDADTLVFHVVRPQEEVEPEAAPVEGDAAATEPEAINEKKTEARAAEREEKGK